MITYIKNVLGYPAALGFVLRNGLSKYFLISGLVSIAIAVVAIGVVYNFSDDVGSFLVGFYPFDWGKDTLSSLSTYITGGLLTALSLIFYKYALLICIGSFMSPLSEKVEQIATGSAPKQQGLKRMGYTMVRGLRLTLRNLFKELLLTLALIILGFVPMLAPFTAIGILLVQAYYLGVANIDYHLEKRLSVSESITYCKSNKMALLGNGSAYLLLLLIPVLGLFLAPVLGTVSATLIALESSNY